MILDPQQKENLKQLLDNGIITKKQFEKAVNPVIIGVETKIKDKLLSLSKFLSPLHWQEDIKYFKSKKLVIYIFIGCLICGGFYLYGYYKPKDQKIPVNANEIVHILKNGSIQLETNEGKVLKIITKDDVDSLKKELSPIALQAKLIGVIGSSFGTGGNVVEGGFGLSWLRLWKAQLDSFITNRAIYPLGISYGLKQIHLPNSALGIAIGKGFQNNGETKIMLYFKVNF